MNIHISQKNDKLYKYHVSKYHFKKYHLNKDYNSISTVCSQVVCYEAAQQSTMDGLSRETWPRSTLGAIAVSFLNMLLLFSLSLICSCWLWSLSMK